jgi:hypothetical protein
MIPTKPSITTLTLSLMLAKMIQARKLKRNSDEKGLVCYFYIQLLDDLWNSFQNITYALPVKLILT